MDKEFLLSSVDLQVLGELDSRQFGFLKLREPKNEKKKIAALKAIQYLERLIIQSNIQERRMEHDSGRPGFNVDPRTYVKLGHLHLLLEDWSKALSAYQMYFKQSKNFWKDSSFLYGLGLVYFKYNSFNFATTALQQVLYVEPGFSRANEVHLRLGLIAKMKNDFDSSLKHFLIAKMIHLSAVSATWKSSFIFHTFMKFVENTPKPSSNIIQCLKTRIFHRS